MSGIFLGLGSNCGDCSRLLRDALVLLEEKGVVTVSQSSVYETEAVLAQHQKNQRNYLNMVIEVETDLPVADLLRTCSEVESLLGRIRGEGEMRWSARTIDIDILLYGSEVVGWQTSACARESVPGDTLSELVVPHPRMHERNFVLVPLVEIASAIMHPVFGVSMVELLRRSCDTHRVVMSGVLF